MLPFIQLLLSNIAAWKLLSVSFSETNSAGQIENANVTDFIMVTFLITSGSALPHKCV